MWTEVLLPEEARRLDYQTMQSIKREKFEIRLIIWETRFVPLVDGDNVDIWVRVNFDPTGWSDDEVEKRTDVHQGSMTGWGLFNWRMKFEIETPCEFPRIKFSVLDEGVFVDEAIGSATINLKKTMNKMQKEELIEVPKSFIALSNPNKPGEDCGILMFSMTILPKEEADNDPVGDSWDEPNHSPFLKKPTVGRGIASAILGGDFNWDFSWNPFAKFFPYILALFVILLILTIAMYWRMFSG